MDPQSIDWKYLFNTTRARVYLLWAAIVLVGFSATHFYQQRPINAVWTVLSAIGLGYMVKVMPMTVKQMRLILLAWLVPIGLGIIVSGGVFYIHTSWAANLLGHLGAFWLLVMAAGYVLNGLVDRPSHWYWAAAAMNAAAGIACFTIDALAPGQYLIAAVIGAWSMLNLWVFRS
jgi:hypothetical protein